MHVYSLFSSHALLNIFNIFVASNAQAKEETEGSPKPQPSVPSTQQFTAFLTHNWDNDTEIRDNHQRVINIKNQLEACGIDNLWLDEERMTADVIQQMTNGIDQSKVVIVFITQSYVEKVAGEAQRGSNDNC